MRLWTAYDAVPMVNARLALEPMLAIVHFVPLVAVKINQRLDHLRWWRRRRRRWRRRLGATVAVARVGVTEGEPAARAAAMVVAAKVVAKGAHAAGRGARW